MRQAGNLTVVGHLIVIIAHSRAFINSPKELAISRATLDVL